MRCGACGSEGTEDGARFCNACGAPFSTDDADVGEASPDRLDDLATTMLQEQAAGLTVSETARRDASADGPITEAIMWAEAGDALDPVGIERGPVTDPTPIDLVGAWEPRTAPTPAAPEATSTTAPPSPPSSRPTTPARPKTPAPVSPKPAVAVRMRPTVMTAVGGLLTVATLLAFTLDILRITTTAPADLLTAARSTGVRVGTWQAEALASNLGLAGLGIAVLAAIGAVGTVLGRTWGAGLVGGAGLSATGVGALAVGLIEQPVAAATRFAELGATEAFTVTIERPLGYWMLLATVTAGVVTFFASINEIFRDRRHDLNPLIAAVGALAVLGAALGPLLPVDPAVFSDNWMIGEGPGTWPTLLVIARLVQIGAVTVGGLLGFLLVRRHGLGLVLGALGPMSIMVATTWTDLGSNPVGPAYRNPGGGSSVATLTVVGTVAAAALLAVAASIAWENDADQRNR
jgi:hypothetical protein